MAKVQNTFIKSKMNKDLDDRILSKGEYRNAQNVNVSKSEGSDVGAMENVLGNIKLDSFTSLIEGAVIIGSFMDYANERIFVMITNYSDFDGNTESTNYAPAGAYCCIAVYNLVTNQAVNLVKGNFLNFSTTNPINDINLIEDLLFWTDDRNQPRKINVDLALSASADSANTHYFNEDQISLAKYNPYKTPLLFSNITVVNFNGPNSGLATIGGGQCRNDGGSSVGDLSITVNNQSDNIFANMAISGGSIPSNTTIVSYDGTTIVLSNALTGSDTTGTTYTITWKLTSSASLIKAGMYLVLDSSIQAQSQNIQISYIVNDTTVNLSSTASTVFVNQTVKIYYPTSYTKNKKFLSPSMAGFIMSGGPAQPFSQSTNTIFSAQFNGTPRVGMLISCAVGGSSATSIGGAMADDTVISAVSDDGGGEFEITTNKAFDEGTLLSGCSVLLSDPNPYYSLNWPGDPDYLESKFVRFAYRFKYEDGEYSLISPFTQPCFVPKQDGFITTGLKKSTIFQKISKSEPGSSGSYTDGNDKYLDFNYSNLSSQEANLAKSTVVSFFENRIQEVDIQIPFEYIVNTLYSNLKIIEIDILYKESDGLQVKVLDTFANTDEIISSNNTNLLTYNYQSRKPFRNLTDAEVVRVYDKVPVRAKTQSVTGNRVVFGNFIDKPTPPLTLNYAVSVSEKFRIDSTNGTNNGFSNISAALAYPNHSVKQNRTYQLGVILQDKYGRASDVILSSLGDETIQFPAGSGGAIFSGSTIFHNYRLSTQNIYNWFGDSIKMLWQNPIPETVSYASGYPGLYRSGVVDTICTQSSSNIFSLAVWNNDIAVGSIVQGIDSSSVSFSEAIIAFDAISTPATITLSNDVAINAGTAVKIIGNANPLGWYSYKIVIKASEEDYYNAYLPNALAGTTQYSINEASNLSHITLTADNINKIPSDITEATPEQTQFRSSDEILFPRVAAQNWNKFSQQITTSSGENPTRSRFFTVDAIGKTTDLGLNTNSPGTVTKASGIYDAASNPTVAKLRTYGTSFGGLYNNPANPGTQVPSFVEDPITGSDVNVLSGSASFFGINVLFGNRTNLAPGNKRGAAIPGWMYPNPKTTWKNDQAVGFVGNIEAGSTGWGYLSNNNQTIPTVNNSIKTSTNSKEGSGMRVRAMCIGPNNDTGEFTSPFQNGNLSNIFWRIETSGSGYEVGDVITVPAVLGSPGQGGYTKWSDEMNFTLEEGHLNTPESSQNIAGLPISVMEIKPTTSNLDIYWETSTTGLISELNNVINTAAKLSQPNSLSFTELGPAKANVYYPESAPFQGVNSVISQFTCLNGINGALGNIVFNLDKVENNSGTIITGDFGLTSLAGTGSIKTNIARAFNQVNNNNVFNFFITATNVSLGISYTNTFQISGSIANNIPSLVKIDGTAAVQSDFEATSSPNVFVQLDIYARNGAYQTVADEQITWNLNAGPDDNQVGGGTWSLQSGQGGTSITAVNSTEVGLKLSKQVVRFTPPGADGTYTNTISVTDGSGKGLTSTTFTMSVVVVGPLNEGTSG
tara:strand:- start:6766 stop:11367 length:4602 start_codon:yes stop_codon:yes gene_type:complete